MNPLSVTILKYTVIFIVVFSLGYWVEKQAFDAYKASQELAAKVQEIKSRAKDLENEQAKIQAVIAYNDFYTTIINNIKRMQPVLPKVSGSASNTMPQAANTCTGVMVRTLTTGAECDKEFYSKALTCELILETLHQQLRASGIR